MKSFRLSAAFLILAAAGFSAEPPANPTPKRELEPGSTRITDENGKRWILKKTPFGVSKLPDDSPEAGTARRAETSMGVKAFDAGDSVRFERMTPFGKASWTKKKDDLDDSEQAAWNAARRKAAASAAPAKSQGK